MYCTVLDRLLEVVEAEGRVRREKQLPYLTLSRPMEGLLQCNVHTLEFRRSCHTSTDKWLPISREITGWIIGVASFRYCSIVEGGLSDIWGEEQENIRVHRRIKKETIKEDATFTNKTSTPSHVRNLLLILFCSLSTWFFVVEDTQLLGENYVLCRLHRLTFAILKILIVRSIFHPDRRSHIVAPSIFNFCIRALFDLELYALLKNELSDL